MPQSAIKIPQGETGVLTIKEPVRIYCRTTGSDTVGDGSITNPFFSIHRAIRYLENYVFVENGRATIDVGPGTFNYSTTCKINDTSGKIAIAGVCPSYFTVREVTDYNYADGSDGNAASFIQNYMTISLVKPEDPSSLNVSGISPGDWVLIENASYQKKNPYQPTASYGFTGGNPDKSISLMGCFQVYSVNSTNGTITVRHKAKNFPFKCHSADVGAAASGTFSSGTNTLSIGVGDPIYMGGPGYDTAGEQAAFDDLNPVGFYGSDSISGTGANPVLIGDEIRVKVIKTVLKWKPNLPAINGVVLNENASIDGIENIIFAGGDCTKYFHEMNPTHAAVGLSLSGNSSVRKYAVSVNNIGFSGWGTALESKNGSTFSGTNIVISNVGNGAVAARNSNIDVDYFTITGADLNGIYATHSSSISCEGAIIGLGGFDAEKFGVVAQTNLSSISSGWTTFEGKPLKIIHNSSYKYHPEILVDDFQSNRRILDVYGIFTTADGGQYPDDGIVTVDGNSYAIGETINCIADRI